MNRDAKVLGPIIKRKDPGVAAGILRRAWMKVVRGAGKLGQQDLRNNDVAAKRDEAAAVQRFVCGGCQHI
jgi:hypothetical protein